jgi:predicted transposase YbfD/YdcC
MCAKSLNNKLYTIEDKETDLESFKIQFEEIADSINDPRSKDNQSYSLFVLIAIIFCAILGNANSITAIHQYAISKKQWLSRWLDLSRGVPSYNTFWWLLNRLNPIETEKLFRQWVENLSEKTLEDIISIDGKRIRGASKRSPKSLLHIVSAWSSCRGVVLGQVKTEEKSNEIIAIPELIDSLDINGATITIDAIGCQKKIAKKIKNKGGEYLLMVKNNQQNLSDEIQNYFEQAQAINFEGINYDYFKIDEKGHGRKEQREIYVVSDIDWLPVKKEWEGLSCIVMLKSFREIGGKISEEKRYYITSLAPMAERIAKAARSHWNIENKVHWILDVNFLEDASQVSLGHSAENLSIIRRLCLNALKLDLDKKKSLQGKRRLAGWNDDYMASILKLMTIKSF